MEIQDLLRASSVKRWIIVNTDRQQNLAEHSFNVAMIAGAIAERMHTIPVSTTMMAALGHDLEEIVLGDIPTPTKRKFAKGGLNYSKVARSIRNPKIDDEGILQVVKSADLMEATWFLMEHGSGRHASDKCSGLGKELQDWMDERHPDLKKAIDEVWDLMNYGDYMT